MHEPEELEEMQETIFEEKDEAAADKAVDNAETEGTAGPDADASDSVSENTTDTAAQNENNSGEQA